MTDRQLKFDFYNEFSSISAPQNIILKDRRNRVYPGDITFFLDQYLPEYKDDILSGRISEGPFRMPKLAAVHDVDLQKLVPFNAVMSLDSKRDSCFEFFHFFIHDYRFEGIWNTPKKHLTFLLKMGYGIGPDFSMYLYMHPTESIINCCRNRILSFFYQKQGITLIPNACFGNELTFNWAFDGLPEHSILAVTSQGCMLDKVSKRVFINGLHELERQKHPEILYVYGSFPEKWKDKFGMPIKTLPTFASSLRRAN
jgi:hypothetical protein